MTSDIEPPQKGDSVLEWAKNITAYCKSLVLRGDGKTCRVSHGPNGTTISVLQRAGGSAGGAIGIQATYSGFFVISDVSDSQYAKIRISDETGVLGAGTCGVFVSGLDKIMVPSRETAISVSGFVVFDAIFTASADGTSGTWETSFRMSPEMPEFTADKFTAVLGWVEVVDGKVGNVVQIWNNGVIYNNRYA